ncbi:hypothetical protein HYS30_01190, partial [Candidatus Peregrinibacteria bacterium]|nr:hypothetical protein [Candidatus Peregrinibacteria bacterium]
FAYRVQDTPGGIAQALGLAEDFAQGESICAILGDNVYFDNLTPAIQSFEKGGHIFLKDVPDPERFGIAEISSLPPTTYHLQPHVLSIEEKPQHPRSNLAITGCYLYDNRCFEIIRNLKPSARGEMEITDVGRWYLDHRELTASILEKEWIDAGTFESLFQATKLVRSEKVHTTENASEDPTRTLCKMDHTEAGHECKQSSHREPATPAA